MRLNIKSLAKHAPLEMTSISNLQVRIDDLFTDGYNSVTLRVSPIYCSNGELPMPMVLKLFDRTFSPRASSDMPASRVSELAYVDFVKNGDISSFLKILNQENKHEETNEKEKKELTGVKNDVDEEHDLTTAEIAKNEASFYRTMSQFHSAEIATYNILDDLQGRHVPKFFADVRLDLGLTDEAAQFPEFFLVKGILIEYIEGFGLDDLSKGAPESSWGAICHQVIKVVNLISDHGVLNEDTTTRNVIIRQIADEFQIVFFDFAYCYPRSAYSSDEDWIEAKRREEEELRLGQVMENLVSWAKGKGKGKNRKRYKGKDPLPFVYHNSYRYGVAGYPAYDENGNQAHIPIPEIHRLPLGDGK